MKPLNFVMFMVLFVATSFVADSQTPINVYGELRAIMQRGDLSAKVLVDTINLKPGTIGLGVVAGLKGEIIIVDGKVYTSSVENGNIISVQGDVAAAMLVTTRINYNRDLLIAEFQSIESLEKVLKPYSTTEPFAFVIRANESDVTYHVIDWKDGVNHTPDNHKQFAVKGKITNGSVVIVGFYSETPGVFTPHTAKVHLHVYQPSTGIVGHVEELNLKKSSIEIF